MPWSSPRSRGWSRRLLDPVLTLPVVSPLAGVVHGRSDLAGPLAQSSPRSRGWSGAHRCPARSRPVVSPLAGVVPRTRSVNRTPDRRLPARGGGPWRRGVRPVAVRSSPRSRGWSRATYDREGHYLVVSPLAGVVRVRCVRGISSGCRLPARGGGPALTSRRSADAGSSPRSRGWSRQTDDRSCGHTDVSPLAGVVRVPTGTRTSRVRRLPARGGGPHNPRRPGGPPWSSPRSRGWSFPVIHPLGLDSVVSPLAGVVLGRLRWHRPRFRRLPARGGGPRLRPLSGAAAGSSPRSRGWSLGLRRRVCLVEVVSPLAGVVPSPTPGPRAP